MTNAAFRQELDNGNTFIHTNGMKIAISIPDSVFRDVKRTAEEQKRSRSEVIVEAVRQYLKDLESRRLMEALDKAYAGPETGEEREARRASRDLYWRTVIESEKEEW
jgi:predicted transcriptional regulator